MMMNRAASSAMSALSDLSTSHQHPILAYPAPRRPVVAPMSTRSPDADSRENSPDHDGSPGGKRASKKRKVLSCFACRNRKMKCDRIYPVCGRCQKTGRADQCTYDPRLLEDLTGNNGVNGVVQPDGHHVAATLADSVGQDHLPGGTSSVDALRFKARAQERRIEELERKLAEKEGNDIPSIYRASKTAEPDSKEEMMFRGKGFKTQFNGSTSVMSTIAQVELLLSTACHVLTLSSFVNCKHLHAKH